MVVLNRLIDFPICHDHLSPPSFAALSSFEAVGDYGYAADSSTMVYTVLEPGGGDM